MFQQEVYVRFGYVIILPILKRLIALEKLVAEQGIILSETQVQALERKKEDGLPVVKLKRYTLAILAHKILSMWATSKEWVVFINKRLLILTVKWRLQNFIMKTAISAADMLNDKVLPYFESQGLPMLRILTDRGSEYCGKVENHDYELYLAINDIEHTKTKVKQSPDEWYLRTVP
ncbi:hypothetical protein OBFLKGFO_02674 [Mannheimia haemolytica]